MQDWNAVFDLQNFLFAHASLRNPSGICLRSFGLTFFPNKHKIWKSEHPTFCFDQNADLNFPGWLSRAYIKVLSIPEIWKANTWTIQAIELSQGDAKRTSVCFGTHCNAFKNCLQQSGPSSSTVHIRCIAGPVNGISWEHLTSSASQVQLWCLS